MQKFLADYAPKGVAMIAINSNETEGHPTDSLDHMKARAKEKGFKFAYVRDDSQDIARAYGALRTPHFYVFDQQRKNFPINGVHTQIYCREYIEIAIDSRRNAR